MKKSKNYLFRAHIAYRYDIFLKNPFAGSKHCLFLSQNPKNKFNATKQNNLCVCDVLENLLLNKFIQKSGKESRKEHYQLIGVISRENNFLSVVFASSFIPFRSADVAKKIWMKRILCFEHLRLKCDKRGDMRDMEKNLNLIQFVQPHVSARL